jgi:hypothetical protein
LTRFLCYKSTTAVLTPCNKILGGKRTGDEFQIGNAVQFRHLSKAGDPVPEQLAVEPLLDNGVFVVNVEQTGSGGVLMHA